MEFLRVSAYDHSSKGNLEEHNSHDDGREVRILVSSDEQRSLNNDDASDVHKKCTFEAQPVPLRKQQQAPGPMIRWERFLPVKTLSVLLVENDDSTRHIVGALLRNCSYQVTAVAHGLEAWTALEDPSTCIDLVLTEVVTPYLSGIDLLSKILSHKTFRSIPLIMMSSDDSMGIVFKCLSKGAIDFLVKPIRKNELKHLWQHVWRKCHTSSFSGSGSNKMIQKPSSLEIIGHAGNKNGSSAEDDNWNTDLNVNNGSDNGSDTQISWSKRVPGTATWGRNKKDDELVAMGKYLEIGVPVNQDLQIVEPNRKMQKIGMGKCKVSDLESKKDHEKFEERVDKVDTEAVDVELSKKYSDSVVVITNSTDPLMESANNESDHYRKNTKDKTPDYSTEPLSLELDLNSLRERDARPKNSDSKQKVLGHLDLSAFSRYDTATNIKQVPTGNVGSCSPAENSSRLNLQSNTDGTNNQCSNGSSNNDMGSTTDNNIFSKPAAFSDKILTDAPTSVHLPSAFQSVKNLNDQSILPDTQDKTELPAVLASSTEQQVQVQHRHHYHHYHHHHHHVHNGRQTQHVTDHDGLSMENTAASASHFAPFKILTSQMGGNATNYGLNKSASGSNNGSNGQNDNIVRTVEGINLSNNNGVTQISRADDGSKNDVEQNNLTQREAALYKFRQKRKDRCFEKKVLYQSRKRLAEQRPRVKGQFVRQAGKADKNEYPNS